MHGGLCYTPIVDLLKPEEVNELFISALCVRLEGLHVICSALW